MSIGGIGGREGPNNTRDDTSNITDERKAEQPEEINEDVLHELERKTRELEEISHNPLTRTTVKTIQAHIRACTALHEENPSLPKRITLPLDETQKIKDELSSKVTCAAEKILKQILITDFSLETQAEERELEESFHCLLGIMREHKTALFYDSKIAKQSLRITSDALDYFDRTTLELDSDLALIEVMLKNPQAMTEEKFDTLSYYVQSDREIMRKIFMKQPSLFRFFDCDKNPTESLLTYESKARFISQVIKDNPEIVTYLSDNNKQNRKLLAQIVFRTPEAYYHFSDAQKYNEDFLQELLDIIYIRNNNSDIKKIIIDIFDHRGISAIHDVSLIANALLLIPEVFSHLSTEQKYDSSSLLRSLLYKLSDKKDQFDALENNHLIKELLVDLFDHLDQTEKNDQRLLVDTILLAPEALDHLPDNQHYSEELLHPLLFRYERLDQDKKLDAQKIIFKLYDRMPQAVRDNQPFTLAIIRYLPELLDHLSDTQKYTKSLVYDLIRDFDNFKEEDKQLIKKNIFEILDHQPNQLPQSEEYNYNLARGLVWIPELFDHLSNKQKYTKSLLINLFHHLYNYKYQINKVPNERIPFEIFHHLDRTDRKLVTDFLALGSQLYPEQCLLEFDSLPREVKEDKDFLINLSQHTTNFPMIKKIQTAPCLNKDMVFLSSLFINCVRNNSDQSILHDLIWKPLHECMSAIIHGDACESKRRILETMRTLSWPGYSKYFNLSLSEYGTMLCKLSEYDLKWPALDEKTALDLIKIGFNSNNIPLLQKLIEQATDERKKTYTSFFIDKNFLEGIDILGKSGFTFGSLHPHLYSPYLLVACTKNLDEIACHIAAFTYPNVNTTCDELIRSLTENELINLLFLTLNPQLGHLLKNPRTVKDKLETITREIYAKISSIQFRERAFDIALSIYTIPEKERKAGYTLLRPLPSPKAPSRFEPLMEEIIKIANDREGKEILDQDCTKNMISFDECVQITARAFEGAQTLGMDEALKKLNTIFTQSLSVKEKLDTLADFNNTYQDTVGFYNELVLLDDLYKTETGKKLIDSYCKVNNKNFDFIKKTLFRFCHKATLATAGLVGGNPGFFKKSRKRLLQLMTFHKEKKNPDAIWYMIKDFIEASSHCIGAYDDAIRMHYDKARLPEKELSPKELLDVEFAKIRSDFLLAASHEQNPHVSESMEVHQHTQAVLDLGEELGIIGANEEKHEDQFRPEGYNKGAIKAIFHQHHIPGKILRKFIDALQESASLRRDCFFRLLAEKSDFMNDPSCKAMRDAAYIELEKWRRGEANKLGETLSLYNLDEKKKLLQQPPSESLVKSLREEIAFRIWHGLHVFDYEQDGVLKVIPDLLFTMRDLFESLGMISLV